MNKYETIEIKSRVWVPRLSGVYSPGDIIQIQDGIATVEYYTYGIAGGKLLLGTKTIPVTELFLMSPNDSGHLYQ